MKAPSLSMQSFFERKQLLKQRTLFRTTSACYFTWSRYRPLALRGHATNASLKQRIVILLLPKIDRTHKNYLTPEIWEETHLRETFYVTLIFQQSSMICIGRHVLLPSNMAAKTIFYLSRVKCLIVTFRCAINATTSSFQHFPWSLSAKLVSESGNS